MNNHKENVLIVDDEARNLSLLREILKEHFKLFFATDGNKAIEIVDKGHIDIILLDVMMPNLNGYQTCQLLKGNRKHAHIPIIFVTAITDVKAEEKGFQLGAVDYITKPFSPPIVLSRVKTHLALHRKEVTLKSEVKKRTQALRLINNELQSTRISIIERLGRAAEYKDNETGLHVIRMSNYSKIIAMASGMPEEKAQILLLAAQMHDIGKIGIPDKILLKPGALNDEEWKIMKQHPRIGAGIIGYHTSDLLNMSRIVALSHHEKWDGSGYPNGLKGEQIPLIGRIVAIADVFDALTTKRPYKEAWPVEKAVQHLKDEAGKHFDPTLLSLFIENLPKVLEVRSQWQENDETTTDTTKEDEYNGRFLSWDPKYSVAVPLLDSHHKQIIDILNRLYDATTNNESEISIEEIFEKLFTYTLDHFSEEEKLMELHNFPDLAIHKLQHLRIKQETDRQYHIFQSNSQQIPPELFLMLKDWWMTHILKFDFLYIPYMNQQLENEEELDINQEDENKEESKRD